MVCDHARRARPARPRAPHGRITRRRGRSNGGWGEIVPHWAVLASADAVAASPWPATATGAAGALWGARTRLTAGRRCERGSCICMFGCVRRPSPRCPALTRQAAVDSRPSNARRAGTYTAVRCTIQAVRGRKLADGPSSVLGGAAAGGVVALSRPTIRSAGASMLLGAGCGFVYHYVRVRVLRERLGLTG